METMYSERPIPLHHLISRGSRLRDENTLSGLAQPTLDYSYSGSASEDLPMNGVVNRSSASIRSASTTNTTNPPVQPELSYPELARVAQTQTQTEILRSSSRVTQQSRSREDMVDVRVPVLSMTKKLLIGSSMMLTNFVSVSLSLYFLIP